MSARQAAALIGDGMVVGASGFARSGDSKAVLAALAEKDARDHTRITLMTGASLGNSAIFAQQARKVIIEINEAVPVGIHGIHDVFLPEDPTGRALYYLRGLDPRQKAQAILRNCVHPDYYDDLSGYFLRACRRGVHTPHLLEEAFRLHANLAATGSMKTRILQSI
ncbi:hypothetical protein GCM10010967_48070 [Dyadobacter beijingensis]|uniref:Acetyl-CoA hydrolase/transferase C-terminal domain-containing protein n=2 Tax=Dyadobacter beijingensis TaxID=365489 RepID=A0ABQ2IDY6_9BACT|nr:hypothetical protein GCM10010967_48070 [Dyadobacter beijingensis]